MLLYLLKTFFKHLSNQITADNLVPVEIRYTVTLSHRHPMMCS